MQAEATRLVLISPYGVDEANARTIVDALDGTCAACDVAAVVLRMRSAEERALVNRVQEIAPAAQRHGAAVMVCCPEFAGDLVSVAVRAGADGVHVDGADDKSLPGLRAALRDQRILGCGVDVESKHDAMAAGEAQADYLMFGGLAPDGMAPAHDAVRERAAWWAEIFGTPCIAVATRQDEVADLIATGAEFLGLEAALWIDDPGAPVTIQEMIRTAGQGLRGGS